MQRRVVPPTILHVGNPALRQRAAPVVDARAPAIARITRQLVLGLDAFDGSGLAAPQIGELHRIIAIRDLFNRLEDKDHIAPHLGDVHKARLLREPPIVALNPTIVSASAIEEEDWESCLSLPLLHGRVRRARSIVVRYTTFDGAEAEHECTGWGARVFQHELDHLDGILFVDRLTAGAAGLVHETELEHHVDIIVEDQS
jgi:peptide deformylase